VSDAESGGEGGGVEVDAFLDLLLDRRLCAAASVEGDVDAPPSEWRSATVEVMIGLVEVLICAIGTDMVRGVTSLEHGEREVGEGGFVMADGGSGAAVRVGFFVVIVGDAVVVGGGGGEREVDVDFIVIAVVRWW
jgi:hypothetical protein